MYSKPASLPCTVSPLHRVLFTATIAAFCTLVLLASAQAADSHSGSPLPLGVRYTQGASTTFRVEVAENGILVPLRIPHTPGQLYFALDSGASSGSFIDNTLAKQLGLTATGHDEMRGAGKGTVAIQHTTAATLIVPGAILSFSSLNTVNLHDAAAQEGWGHPVAGILGSDLFGQCVITIDYDNHSLTLSDPHTFNYRGSGEILPLKFIRKWAYVSGTLKVPGVPATDADFMIDSGSGDGVNHQLITKSTGPLLKTQGGVGLGQGFESVIGRVEYFQLGKFIIYDALSLPWGNAGEKTGQIGSGILRRFKVIFNYSKSQLILEPGKLYGQPYSLLTHGHKPPLAAPNATPASDNPPHIVTPPPDFLPTVPHGFSVNVFARGFKNPRWLAVAPNGDVLASDSTTNEITILRDKNGAGIAQHREVFVGGLTEPFAVATHNGYLYVANTNEILRYRFDPKTSKRTGPPEHVLTLPGNGYNQHWTRTIAFTRDGKRLFVSVGSETDASIESDTRRAAVLVCDPDGKNMRVYASGLRNAVGLAFDPWAGNLWASVNERDGLGDELPPDYFTSIQDNGFYGWPYSYIGDYVDIRIKARPELVAKAIVPDLLLGAHVAPLQIAFYNNDQFPEGYNHGAFLVEHGSWNRSIRSGYQVVYIPFLKNQPSSIPEPFLTGFVPDVSKADVYGRPAGIAVARDGALLVSDDEANVIYRIAYRKRISQPTAKETKY